jgi:hypothetical protein
MVKVGDWTPTEHFQDRLDQRKIDLQQVLEAIEQVRLSKNFPSNLRIPSA